jgi:hypothetical protein
MITHGLPLKAFSLQPIYLSSYFQSYYRTTQVSPEYRSV